VQAQEEEVKVSVVEDDDPIGNTLAKREKAGDVTNKLDVPGEEV
jgi:hypothetical protein